MVGKPYLESETNAEGDWRCPFQITGLDQTHSEQAAGIDAIQAMLRSLYLAKQLLETYACSYSIKITWQGEDDLELYEMCGTELPDPDVHLLDVEVQRVFEEVIAGRTNGKR